MTAAKETTLKEVGEMLTHVVDHMATKDDITRLSKIPQWHRPIGQAGAALLIAGLASEMISARRSHNINDQITANLTNHAARLTAEAESARAAIAVANARAAQARVRKHRLGAGHGGGREVEPLGLEMPSIVYGT